MADAPNTHLFDLMSWMSPSWPVGAFAHSGGLEWAVEAGHVTDRPSCEAWIADLLAMGPIQTDLILFVHAWRAAALGDADRLRDVADLATATATGFERRLESVAQGGAFRRIAASTSGEAGYAGLLEGIEDEDLAYPVASATLFACRAIPIEMATTAYLHGVVANLVSAAQRLVPLGQTDGQRVIHALRPSILHAAAHASALPDDDPFDQMGSACLMAELGCMAHETQYTRLFRT